MELTARVRKCHYYDRQELCLYKGGHLAEMISIDRTYDGPKWCKNHGMTVTDTITADTGERFDIWRLENRLVCAIPAKEA